MARLAGLLLACLFLVAPSVDALCRASCTPAATAPSCHDGMASRERPHLTAAASCQREVVIAAPTLDGRRGLVAPTAMPATAAVLLATRLSAGRAAPRERVRPSPSPGCPRSPVLRI